MKDTKKQKIKFVTISSLLLIFTYHLSPITYHLLFAQEDSKLVSLTKQVIEAKNEQDIFSSLESLKDFYLLEKKFVEFIEFLKSLSQKKKALEPFVNYYIASSRYSQLKYLEEIQNWNEYFNNGNAYREELVTAIQRTIDSTKSTDALNLYARLLVWQLHKEQQDAQAGPALAGLMQGVLEYSKEGHDPKLIKGIADKLLEYAEKGKSKELYKLYVNRITSANITDNKLKEIARGFYQEGNLELSEGLYDVYIESITKEYSKDKEKLKQILIEIAKLFSLSTEGEHPSLGNNKAQKDAVYAEKIFKKMEELVGKDAFDEGLMYLRAYNLEKIKEYLKAKDFYSDLAGSFPQSAYASEARFKTGLIHTYILRDIKSGRNYFEGLAQEITLSPQVILSLYQLGLLSQWEGDILKAREYYSKLLEKTGNDFIETTALAKERLKEIEESRPVQYNLKTFLDISLREGNAVFDATRADLTSSGYSIKKGEDVTFSSNLYNIESGCMQVQIQYLWSGDTGTVSPSSEQSAFNTAYAQPGTKIINLVVVSPAGVIDRNIEIVDVY